MFENETEEFEIISSGVLCSSFGYSLATTELSLRSKGFVLVRLKFSISLNLSKKTYEKLHETTLRALFYCGVGYRLSRSGSLPLFKHQKKLQATLNPQSQSSDDMLPPLMSLEMFSVLLQLIFIWPRPSTLMQDFYYMVNLTFRGLLTQVFLHYSLDQVSVRADNNLRNSQIEIVADSFTQQVKSNIINLTSTIKNLTIQQLAIPTDHLHYMKSVCMPFLRRSALFLSVCLGQVASFDTQEEEFDVLRLFLKLPSIQEIFDSFMFSSYSLERIWMGQFLDASKINKTITIPRLLSAEPFRLISLPHLYHDLLQKYSKVRCKNCNLIPATGAICLVCGMLVCAGNSCCRYNF